MRKGPKSRRALVLYPVSSYDIQGPSGDDTDPDERLTYEEFEQCLKSLVHDENATIESVLEDVVDPVVFVR